MRKCYLILILALLGIGTSTLHAHQSITEFDSIYLNIATEIVYNDIDKAVIQADSLVNNSQNTLQSIKAHLLLAMIYESKGEFADALVSAGRSEKLAIKDKNFEYQVRAAGYLATLYRRVDLIKESNRHIQIAEDANRNRKTEPNYFAIQSIIHHEKSMHEIDNGNYKDALVELEKSEESLMKSNSSSENDFFLSTILESYASTYINIGDFDKALEKAEQSLKLA